jgi:heavy metal sensor kinase
MQVSLRARLTAWYSLLVVLTVAVFAAAVLWLHWRLLLKQFDDGLQSIAATADNVFAEELEEVKDRSLAAAEMAAVVRAESGVVQVLDATGASIGPAARPMPLPPGALSTGANAPPETLIGPEGQSWRVLVRRSSSGAHDYYIATGLPLTEALEQWRTLLRVSLIGLPLALLFAAAGGWWLGWYGLLPMKTIAAEAQAITAKTPDSRLTVPDSITELAQLAGSFNHVLDRLSSALTTQRRFMADASHELRTPVSIARTAAQVTLGQPRRGEGEYREALGVIAKQTSRLTRLVDDMLVLARADGGGYPMVAAQVRLDQLVAESVREFGAPAEDREIALHATVQPMTLTGDETLLRRMLSNLIGNAVTYTPQGGSVDISLSAADSTLLVRVADTGPGIPIGDRERVFERFVRLDPARAAGGSGLGLAIARWIAEAHGGTLRVESSNSSGTVFAASLPAERASGIGRVFRPGRAWERAERGVPRTTRE